MDFFQNFSRILMPFASTFPVGILSEKKLAAEFFGAVVRNYYGAFRLGE